jgi:hypothetical protein
MDFPHEVETRLTVNGFTMNPITNPMLLSVVINGLVSYKDNHLCDYGQASTHKNYLGKKITEPIVTVSEDKSFIQAHVGLTNGWINIRITNNVYPAKVVLDAYVAGDIKDADLIIDHLCAPALPMDGIGMFDYTYTLQSNPILNNAMSKHNHHASPYKLNDPALVSDGSVEVTLNKLSSIECHFCSSPAVTWLIVGPPMGPEANKLVPPRVVTSCKSHMINGRVTEIRYSIEDIPEKDFVKAGSNAIQYEMLDVLDEDGNLKYTINKIKEN